MSPEYNLVPKRRFEEFRDAPGWEQRRLGDVFEKAGSGGTPTTSNDSYYGGNIPFLGISDIKKRHIYNAEKTLTMSGLNNSTAWLVPKGAISLAMYASVGRVGILCQDTATSQAFYNMVFNNESIRDFVYTRLEKAELFNEWEPLISTGTQRNLNAQKVSNWHFSLPNVGEATLVASFFRNLDYIITLHQHKLDKLKELKQSYLAEMFPAEGERTPKLRFAGFTDDWEQRKLSDLVERVVRKNTNNECNLPLTISAQYGLVDQITYFNNRVASLDVSNYYLVMNGEFAYNKSTSEGFPFGAVKRLDLYEMGVLSTLYIVFGIKDSEEVNSDFLTVLFDTDRWHQGVAERAAEGARNHGLLNISVDDFFNIVLYLPKQETEQACIGAFMKRLDHLITLHQRKFEKLQNLKKAYLHEMFPRTES